jgi:NAD(P)-dependent dehydrogenase (short-subunit alcohol dehydrogenase family)
VDKLQKSADELSKATGKICIAAPADVRKPEQLKAAVAKAIENFGRLDFVICGVFLKLSYAVWELRFLRRCCWQLFVSHLWAF